MNSTTDTVIVIAVLVVITIIVSMAVGLIYGMPPRYMPYFFAAAFAVLAGITFAMHWALGTFVVIIGAGGVAALFGAFRILERTKAVREETTTS